MGLHTDWIPVITSWAANEPRIAAVYAFGSRAKGTDREDSDLDLALVLTEVESDPAEVFAFCEKQRLVDSLAPLLPVKVHLDFAFNDDIRVWPAVKEHGVLIYPEGWSAHPLFVPTG